MCWVFIILSAQREKREITELVLTGGGARGDASAQILSDVPGVRLHRLDHVETATSIAAAVIAGVGVGVFKDFSVIHQFAKEDDFCPDGGNSQVYKRQKKLFEQGYRCLKEYYRLDSSL